MANICNGKEDRVSIIVPVYNVRPYLDQCIESIVHQTYENLEIILIDDGSTDGSGDICKKYAGLDSRIKFISQRNQGVVTARKNGVLQATGTYIGFVDADDYLDADLYQQLMACRGSFDLVIAQWYREENGKTRRAFDKIALGAYQSQDDMEFLLDHLVNVSTAGGAVNIKSGLAPYMYNKLHKASITKAVFEEVNGDISFAEDVDFTYRYFLRCKSVLITDICGYHYRIRPDSAAHIQDMGCRYLKNVTKLYETLYPVFHAHPRRDSLLPQLQFKVSMMLAKAPAKMGFPPEARGRTIVCPFLYLLEKRRIALYGAGEAGRCYLRQISQLDGCAVDFWVDENWREYRREGSAVSPVEELRDAPVSYVVIAALHEAEADGIRRRLCTLGVPEEKILWSAPVII